MNKRIRKKRYKALLKRLGISYRHFIYGEPKRVTIKNSVLYIDYYNQPKQSINFVFVNLSMPFAG